MPTPRGWLVASVGAALLVCGALAGYQELVTLGGCAVLVVSLAALWVGRPARVQAHRSPSASRTSAGAPVTVRLRTRNPGMRAVQLWERITAPSGEQWVRFPQLGRDSAETVEYRLEAERRGVITLGPVRAGRRDALGLAESVRSSVLKDRVWVHPPYRRLRAIPAGRVTDLDSLTDGVRAGSQAFHTLRDYVPGDDLRQVHWRSSARLDKLVVREHVDTAHTRLRVVLDDRPTPRGVEDLDEAASVAASVIATGLHASLHCELHLVSGRGRDSTSGLTALLDLLAEAEPRSDASLKRALRLLRARPSGDTAMLVSPSLTDAELRSFGQLRNVYHGLIAVVVGSEAPATTPTGITCIATADARSFAERWDTAPWPR